MSGPPRPRCRRHGKNDHQDCIGYSRENYGVDYHEAYFGDPDRPYTRLTSVRPAGRMLDKEDKKED